jgi:protein SCO1
MQRTHILLAVTAVLAAATAALAATAVLASRSASPAFHATDLGPGYTAPDFTLEAAELGPVSLSDYRGRVVVMFFGYTQCPDVCPLTMGKLRLAMERLGAGREDVQVLLITVDPEEDSPARLREYLLNFDPAFVGLGGTRRELEVVAGAYGAYMGQVQPAPVAEASDVDDDPHAHHRGHGPPPRLIDHTSQVFGIDRRGDFRLLWGSEATAEEIAEDVGRLLRL